MSHGPKKVPKRQTGAGIPEQGPKDEVIGTWAAVLALFIGLGLLFFSVLVGKGLLPLY